MSEETLRQMAQGCSNATGTVEVEITEYYIPYIVSQNWSVLNPLMLTNF